jgi:hypothetical protein
MVKITREDILKTITAFYLKSHDFNGIPSWTLSEKFKQDWALLRIVVRELIEDEMVGLIDTNTDVNPHIIRRGFEPKDIQISKIDSKSSPDGCIYPTQKHLNSVVNPQDYEGKPYNLCLALGEAQLAYRSFDLSILEFYRNDPRYRYENDDIRGYIYYDAEEMSDNDKVVYLKN